MFDLYYGNNLKTLADQMAMLLSQRTSAELLTPQRILIPHNGLRRWLCIYLAERYGIVANLKFSTPSEWVWELLRAEHPDLPERSFFEPALLRFRLLPLLTKLDAEQRFPALRQYLPDGNRLKRFEFAGSLAHCFERYQAYRRDLLEAWERGADPDDWQAELWRLLVQSSDQLHRARLLIEYLKRYTNTQKSPPGLPQRVFAFGCITISPDVLRFLGLMGQHCELAFFLPNPCRQYWGDQQSERERLRQYGAEAFSLDENPLLGAWGHVGRDFIARLFSYDEVMPHREVDLSHDPVRDSLLHHVQSDILDRVLTEKSFNTNMVDKSLQFHACHSPLRELQVLHDRLLDLFETLPNLEPREIAVMMPDITSYAPYIHAVFGALAMDDARRIPYSISDRAMHDQHPIIKTFFSFLDLRSSRRTATEVLDLLAVPAVMKQLKLDNAALERLRYWVKEAGIRWGYDENDRERVGAGRYREFSWAFGLERLLMGYASGASDSLVADIAPITDIEGNAAEALGILIAALRKLDGLIHAQHTLHSAQEWQHIYRNVLDFFFLSDVIDHDESVALDALYGALAALSEESVLADCNELLDWQSVSAFLQERLTDTPVQQRFLSGGVTFCAMLPLRSVPFRVICVIGMNDDAFPRHEPLQMINRMHHEYIAHGRIQPGDRSIRDDDRYLFLQLLTAAEDVFYMSWIGEDLRDGSVREPSMVVSELLDVVANNYYVNAVTKDALIVHHPLHPFSPHLFENNSNSYLFTYRNEWRSAAASAYGVQPIGAFADAILEMNPPLMVDLNMLIDFFSNPAKYFFTQKCGLRFYQTEELLNVDDPMTLNALERYTLRTALVESLLENESSSDKMRFFRARALLPMGMAADDAVNAEISAASAIAETVKRLRVDPFSLSERVSIDMGAGMYIDALLPAHANHSVLEWTAGRAEGKRLIKAWLTSLAVAVYCGSCKYTLISIDKDDVSVTQIEITRSEAKAHLRTMLDLYHQGGTQPLLFMPKTSGAYTKAWLACGDAHSLRSLDALRAAKKVFVSDKNNYGEESDAWFSLALRGRDIFTESRQESVQFTEIARAVYIPLITSCSEREV